jgi:hypothetical protein
MERLGLGFMAGAAGPTALNLVSYADLLIRARSASPLPAEVAGSLADRIDLPLGSPASEKRKPRDEALGALLGLANGILLGVAYSMLHPRLAAPARFGTGIYSGWSSDARERRTRDWRWAKPIRRRGPPRAGSPTSFPISPMESLWYGYSTEPGIGNGRPALIGPDRSEKRPLR